MKKIKKWQKILIILICVIVALAIFVVATRGLMQIGSEEIGYNELIERFEAYFIIPQGYEDFVVSARVDYPVSAKTGGGGAYNSYTIKDKYATLYRLDLSVEGVYFSIIARKEDPNLSMPTPPPSSDEILDVIISSNGQDFVCQLGGHGGDYVAYEFAFDDTDYLILMSTSNEKYFEVLGDLIYAMVKQQ